MSASDSNFNRLGSENKMLQLLQITGILAFLILFMNFCDGASSWHVAYAFSMVNTQLMERSLYFHLNNTGFLNFQRWKWFFSMGHCSHVNKIFCWMIGIFDAEGKFIWLVHPIIGKSSWWPDFNASASSWNMLFDVQVNDFH